MKMDDNNKEKKRIVEEKEEKKEELSEDTGNNEADMAQKLADKETEIKEYKEKLLRLAAELENFKKRIEREKAEYLKFALENFAKELLPFLDNLERAVATAKESRDLDKLIEGLELSLSGYLKTLEHFGLKTFVAKGEKFDPKLHEALSVQEQEGVGDDIVIKELLKGYALHEKVLRPALVIVSKNTGNSSGQEETNA
ncbi:MAG: nucleotide exchange factor GrpE [Nitrospiraceae bacterium]|nr:nucleotide exchange factor GrpE [Nitrospiraceae bacterium]